MDIDELIETLRQRGVVYVRAYGRYCSICDEIVTALSTLQAENEKLRDEVESLKKGHCTGCSVPVVKTEQLKDLNDAPKLRAELEQVKAERDAIEQDFRDFTKQWWEEDSGFPCRWCKFENAGSCEWKVKCQSEEKICAGRAFEWRGKKED